MGTVNNNRMEGIRTAFDLVHRALKENYPELRRVLPAQLPEAMKALVDKGEMEPDIELSVRQLYELLVMPEWQEDRAGDTRGYAFLMLAEGAIHSILRSAQTRNARADEEPSRRTHAMSAPDGIKAAWRGIYNRSFPIKLDIDFWTGEKFYGSMTYPDEGTVTSIAGTVVDEADSNGIHIRWTEPMYLREGGREVVLGGVYEATIRGNDMEGTWYQGQCPVARFTMTASDNDETTFTG